MALTKRAVDALAYKPAGPTQQILWDGGLPGFGCRVYPTGKKSYVLSYRTRSGRTRILTLGQHGVITPAQAREDAVRSLAAVSRGEDPAEARQAARKGDTVRDFVALYMERHAKKHKKSWKEDERRLSKHVLPALGSKKLMDVQRSDIARLHTRIGATTQVEANRTVEVLSVMFRLASEWGHLPEDHRNPAAGVKAYKEQSRERWVTEQEMPLLWAAIAAEDNPYVRGALRLYLLTGVRKNELLPSRWADIDFDRRELRLPTTKNGKPHTVPLSDPAIDELRALPARMLGNPYVFASTQKPRTHIVNIDKAWRRVRARLWLATNPEAAATLRAQAEADLRRKHVPKTAKALDAHLLVLAAKRAGGPGAIRLHDLRRTVGSWMANAGVSLQVIGATLNNPSAAELYARLRNSAPREALDDHGARIMAVLREG